MGQEVTEKNIFSIFNDFNHASKVWIYQSDRLFSDNEASEIRSALDTFTNQWAAHGSQLKAAGDVFYNCFIVLMVDESQAGASGCSIDSSVHFIKEVEAKYKVDLFNRLNVAYRSEEGLKIVSKVKFKQLTESGEVDHDAVVFNNLVSTKEKLEKEWEVKLKDSWHSKLIK